MTAEEMAALHAAAFTSPRPWSAEEFETLLAQPGTDLLSAPEGFALIRTIADETELLTIAVSPLARRKGTGRALLDDIRAAANSRRAARIFLEVASDNSAALALYRSSGFSEAGRRAGYYRHSDESRADAIVMVLKL